MLILLFASPPVPFSFGFKLHTLSTVVLFYLFSSSPNPLLQILERERMHSLSHSEWFSNVESGFYSSIKQQCIPQAFVHYFSLLDNITYRSVYFLLILFGNLSMRSKILQFSTWGFP